MIRKPRQPRDVVKGFSVTLFNVRLFQIVHKMKQYVSDGFLKYAVFGEEETTSGKTHLQGYVYLNDPRTELVIRRKFPTAHVEIAMENIHVNCDYCTKGGKYLEFGNYRDAVEDYILET